MSSPKVVVLCQSGNLKLALELAAELGLPLVMAANESEADFTLEVTVSGLQLQDMSNRQYRPLQLDFERSRDDASTRNPLRRALGPGVETVVDVTAGWVVDALQMARSGLQVIALERDLVVAAMLVEAWHRCQDPLVRQNLRVVRGEGTEWLAALESAPDSIYPDVVYMDPMFPEKRRKSAATRKEMSILQRLVGRDTDSRKLLDTAIRVARRRVVVKRPGYAPPLDGPAPAGSVSGKLVRFDIYKSAKR